MMNGLFFILGSMLGGFVGVVTMSLFQIHRERYQDDPPQTEEKK
jgi:hypothetical protein